MSQISKTSDDIDHDETSNRNHNSDDLSPNAIDAVSVSASESITDPEGNTVTSLSDPVRVTEEASTFAESDVTVTHNNTQAVGESVELINSVVIDDFEDGDISVGATDWFGWDGDTASLSAQQSTVISGNYSGESKAEGVNIRTRVTRDNATTSALKLTIIIGSDVNNEFDSVFFTVLTGTADGTRGNPLVRVVFNDSGGNVETYNNNVELLASWSAGQEYTIEFKPDFANDNVDIFINGTNEGTDSLESSVSDWGQIEIFNSPSQSGATRSVYVDDVVEGKTPTTTGNTLIEWDSAVPTDIQSYDLATFQRTLDTETVTIDVEDAAGNVLFSDIGPNFDISTVDTSKEVKLRANLSRNDTANNPTVDYLARRFSR